MNLFMLHQTLLPIISDHRGLLQRKQLVEQCEPCAVVIRWCWCLLVTCGLVAVGVSDMRVGRRAPTTRRGGRAQGDIDDGSNTHIIGYSFHKFNEEEK